jgi:hypothetical protein
MPPLWFLQDLEDRKKRRDKDSTDRAAFSSTTRTYTTQPTTTNRPTSSSASQGHKKVDSATTCVGDGKSKDCNRSRTFSTFVDGANMSDTEQEEKKKKGDRFWRVVRTTFGGKGKEKEKKAGPSGSDRANGWVVASVCVVLGQEVANDQFCRQ